MKEQITYDIFDKVDIRLGTVLSVKKNEKAKRGFKILLVIVLTILTHALFAKSLKLLGFLIMPITITITNYLLYTKHKKFRTFLLGLLIVSFVIEIFYL